MTNPQRSEAIADIARACKKLSADQKRIARRNARRIVQKAVRRLLDQIDRDYPLIQKPKAERKPKPKRNPKDYIDEKFVLSPQSLDPEVVKSIWKVWDIRTANLFMRIARAIYPKFVATQILCHPGAEFMNVYNVSKVYFSSAWSNGKKWKHLVGFIAINANVPGSEVALLLHRFYRELIPSDDLSLAAEHQIFLSERPTRKEVKRESSNP